MSRPGVPTDVTDAAAVEPWSAATVEQLRSGRHPGEQLRHRRDARPCWTRSPRSGTGCMATNVRGTYLATRAAGRHLVEQGSRQGRQHRLELRAQGRRRRTPPTAASKAAVIAFTRCDGGGVGAARRPGERAGARLLRDRHERRRPRRPRRVRPGSCERDPGPPHGRGPTSSQSWLLLLAGPASDFMTGEVDRHRRRPERPMTHAGAPVTCSDPSRRPSPCSAPAPWGRASPSVIAQAGHRTILFDISTRRTCSAGIDTVARLLRQERLARQARRRTQGDGRQGRPRRHDRPAPTLSACDVVVEAVFEDLAAQEGASSAELDDDRLASHAVPHQHLDAVGHRRSRPARASPERVVGTHYCNPAPLMKLVEVADGRHTADWAPQGDARVPRLAWARPRVVTKDRPGFIVNRFLIPWENSCIRALEAGLGTKESIDAAVLGALGHPMGPFRLLDIVGHRHPPAGRDAPRTSSCATRGSSRRRWSSAWSPPVISAGRPGAASTTYDNTRLFGS